MAEIQSGAFQLPDNALWNIAGYVLTVLIAGFSGYRWGLRSQIYGKKLEIKTSMLPLIEKFIIRTKGDRIAWISLRPDSIGLLFDPAIKLKSLLTGSQKRRFVLAWECFSKTTPEEFHVAQPNEEGEQEEKMRQMFLSRLIALKATVEDC